MSPVRCYTNAEVRAFLKVSVNAFDRMKKAGELPWLEELRPRAGRIVRYRADLVDRYFAGQWGVSAFRRRA